MKHGTTAMMIKGDIDEICSATLQKHQQKDIFACCQLKKIDEKRAKNGKRKNDLRTIRDPLAS